MAALPSLACPECQTPLSTVREEAPWCECGWSSTPDTLAEVKFPASLQQRIKRDRQHARWLAEMDTRTLQLLTQPKWRWLWHLYLGLTVIMCLPVLFVQMVLWVVGLGVLLFLLSKSWLAFAIACALIGGTVALDRWAKPPTIQGIRLSRSEAPALFAFVDEVAAQAHTPSLSSIRLFLHAEIGIRQYLTWRSGPHWETELGLGLLALEALTQTQFKTVLAHELAHLRHRDTVFILLIANALTTLDDWMIGVGQIASRLLYTSLFGTLLGLFMLVIYYSLRGYLFSLIWLSRWAMRRQEYAADHLAARLYGVSPALEALIQLGAYGLKFKEYLPVMAQNFQNNMDRHDFHYQFTTHWAKLPERLKQRLYAEAVASFRSKYDTHPTYQDRRRALLQLPALTVSEPHLSAHELLPNRHEFGRELTIELIKHWRGLGW